MTTPFSAKLCRIAPPFQFIFTIFMIGGALLFFGIYSTVTHYILTSGYAQALTIFSYLFSFVFILIGIVYVIQFATCHNKIKSADTYLTKYIQAIEKD